MALLGNSGSLVALEGRGRAAERHWKMVKLFGGLVQAEEGRRWASNAGQISLATMVGGGGFGCFQWGEDCVVQLW